MRILLPYASTLCLGRLGPWPLPLFPKVYLSEAERHKHLYVLGITGKGKSKFLEGLILQDILAGRGCGVIDPHSDLVNNVVAHLVARGFFDQTENKRRVLHVDINRPETVLPFNILAVPGEPYSIAQLVIEAFRRTWPEALKEAPQFTNIMLASLVVLIKTDKTLVDIHRLLSDTSWRESLLSEAGDEGATAFFHDRYDQWGREAPLMRESALNKVSAFAFNPILQRMLGQPKNALDFRAMMDRQQVLLCDLGGEPETRRLLGSLLVTFLEYAAFTRRDCPTHERTPFYLYMDEFQDFSANDGSAKTLSQILSEARKFGLHLTLAHQSLSQLQTRLLGAIGNIQTKVLFGMSRQDAEVFGRAVGQVDLRAVKDRPKTDYQHALYESLQEQWEGFTSGLQWQPPQRAHVIDNAGRVFRISTLPLPDPPNRIEANQKELRPGPSAQPPSRVPRPCPAEIPFGETVT